MKPNIEQLKTTLKRGKGEYVPLMELGIHSQIKEKFLGRPLKTLQDDVDFWHRAGYDYIKLQPGVEFNLGGQLVPDSDDSSRRWADEGQGVIKNWDDFEQFKFPGRHEIDYRSYEKAKTLLPDGMGIVGQYGDIFTMTWELMGLEGFSFALFENPALVTALNEKIGALVLSMFEYMAQSDVIDVLWYSDDIAYSTGLLMSPDVLNQYIFPWLKRIGELAQTYDKPLIYHTDGVLFDVMENIINCGVDALHPIEPKAMDIVEVKQRYGARLCLIGNLDVGDILTRGSVEDVQRVVRYNIEQVGYNGGYCIGSGNSIPEYVKFENYMAMLKAAKDYGVY